MQNLMNYGELIASLYKTKNIDELNAKVLPTVIKLIANKYKGVEFSEYLNSLDTSSIHPFSKLMPRTSSDKQGDRVDLENVIAVIAIQGLWQEIAMNYKPEKVLKVMNTELYSYYNDKTLNNQCIPFIEELRSKGGNIQEITLDGVVNGIEYFNTLLNLKDALGVYTIELSEDEKTRKEKLKNVADIDGFIKTMLPILTGLYESGFAGLPSLGLLLTDHKDNTEVIDIYKLNAKGKLLKVAQDKGTIIDIKAARRLNQLNESYLETVVTTEDSVPNINVLLNRTQGLVCADFHLHMQTANMNFVSSKTSIAKWVKETKGISLREWQEKEGIKGSRIQKWRDVKEWYKWVLANIYIEALMEYEDSDGILQGRYDERELEIISAIGDKLIEVLSNVILVVKKETGVSLQLRVGFAGDGVAENLANVYTDLEQTLNGKNGTAISVKAMNSNVPSIKNINIIIDKAKANKSTLFAGDVVDSLIDAGQPPSWQNVLLGLSEDGSNVFWDKFANPELATPTYRAYSLFAGSRSGKGTMTSALVTAAIADACQVFYTDGKPENGAALGRLAWEEGREAYVFDGQPSGALPFVGAMEDYTFGVRSSNETEGDFTSGAIGKYKEIFEVFGKDGIKTYMGVMRYLRSLRLCLHIIIERAAGTIPNDKWQLWVFDEMTAIASKEAQVRKLFAQYITKSGLQKYFTIKNIASDGSSISIVTGVDKIPSEVLTPNSKQYNVNVKFINDWLLWMECFNNMTISATAITLGKANLNLLIIFQNAKWLNPNGLEGNTTLASVARAIGLNSTKIIGRNALVDRSGNYGAASTLKSKWYEEVSRNGSWAISKSPDLRTAEVDVFKPYNIFAIKMNVVTNELTDEVPPGLKEEYYLKGYLEKLLKTYNLNCAEILESAYNYADDVVKNLSLGIAPKGKPASLKNYIYDCTDFEVKASELFDTKGKPAVERDMQDTITQTDGFSSLIDEDDYSLQDEVVPEGMNDNTTIPSNLVEGLVETPEVFDTDLDNSDLDNSDLDNSDIVDDIWGTPTPEVKIPPFSFDLAGEEAKYLEIINKIEKAKDNLVYMPRKEANEPKFNNLKSETLRNFNGVYATNKIAFLNKLKTEITSTETRNTVLGHFEVKFTGDFERLKQEIQELTFNIAESIDDNLDSEIDLDTEIDTTSIENEPIVKTQPAITQANLLGSPNKLSKQVVTSVIDTKDLQYNVNNEDRMGNVKAAIQISQQVVKDIKKQFGGLSSISDLGVTANGCLIVNDYTYIPQFGDAFVQSLGQVAQQELLQGRINNIVNLGYVINALSRDLYSLSIESPRVCNSTLFKSELGIKDDYGVLFKRCSDLQVISLPNEELTRNNPSQKVGTGLGAKLSSMFGFGNSNTAPRPENTYEPNPMVEQFFNSRPVKILTGAFGWTMGVKAVALAATVFGPWGLLFGGIAAASTYNELKNGKYNAGSTNNTKSKTNSGQKKSKSTQIEDDEY